MKPVGWAINDYQMIQDEDSNRCFRCDSSTLFVLAVSLLLISAHAITVDLYYDISSHRSRFRRRHVNWSRYTKIAPIVSITEKNQPLLLVRKYATGPSI